MFTIKAVVTRLSDDELEKLLVQHYWTRTEYLAEIEKFESKVLQELSQKSL